MKRGGGTITLTIDAITAEAGYAREPHHSDTPDRAFCKRWALDILRQAREQVQRQYAEAGKQDLFDELAPHITSEADVRPLAKSAALLGLTENAAKVAAHRLRQRYGEVLRSIVGQTLTDPAEVDDEIRFLIASLEK